ncbi:DUF6314 family protein [Arthrobacter sp. B1805]|uniref:DUF6314 family protein n=1 Tax=Arthrobacter sp. B1805 TaxID=2058892 RepID=UPI000CE5567E|nr:DUF6314 family protein [Arthrobacter sp. B1805]
MATQAELIDDHLDRILTEVDDAIALLTGTWSTHRTLLDRASGTAGIFTGTTTFTPADGGLRWDEAGTVFWPHFRGPASRSYSIEGDGSAIAVHFEDGRLLCRLDLSHGRARDDHACAPDTYRVEFAVTSPDTIEYSWDVTGPAKDLLLTTTLTRVTQ